MCLLLRHGHRVSCSLSWALKLLCPLSMTLCFWSALSDSTQVVGVWVCVTMPDLSLSYSSQKRDPRKESLESRVRREMRQRAGELGCSWADTLLGERKCETVRWSCPQESTKAWLRGSPWPLHHPHPHSRCLAGCAPVSKLTYWAHCPLVDSSYISFRASQRPL